MMMELEIRAVGFNQGLVEFMQDNPDVYISIKGIGCAQLMFEEDANDEKLIATLVARSPAI